MVQCWGLWQCFTCISKRATWRSRESASSLYTFSRVASTPSTSTRPGLSHTRRVLCFVCGTSALPRRAHILAHVQHRYTDVQHRYTDVQHRYTVIVTP